MKLDNLITTQEAQRAELCDKVFADKSQQITELSCQLNAIQAELAAEIKDKETELTLHFEKYKGMNSRNSNMDISFRVQELQDKRNVPDFGFFPLYKVH